MPCLPLASCAPGHFDFGDAQHLFATARTAITPSPTPDHHALATPLRNLHWRRDANARAPPAEPLLGFVNADLHSVENRLVSERRRGRNPRATRWRDRLRFAGRSMWPVYRGSVATGAARRSIERARRPFAAFVR